MRQDWHDNGRSDVLAALSPRTRCSGFPLGPESAIVSILPHIDPQELRHLLEPSVRLLPLTPRLRDVFFHICAGQTTSEIAQALGISPHTAVTESKLLCGRLGVSGHRAVRSIAMALLLDLIRRSAPPPLRIRLRRRSNAPMAMSLGSILSSVRWMHAYPFVPTTGRTR
jgi:DNA-binding CsgD family transcriptional regulator